MIVAVSTLAGLQLYRDAIVAVDAWFLIRVIIRVFMNNSKM